MNKRAASQREFRHQSGANGYLDSLNGVHDRKAQLAIEGVSLPDRIEGCPWGERVIRLLERMPIGAQSVVAHRLKAPEQHLAIGDHPAVQDRST